MHEVFTPSQGCFVKIGAVDVAQASQASTPRAGPAVSEVTSSSRVVKKITDYFGSPSTGTMTTAQSCPGSAVFDSPGTGAPAASVTTPSQAQRRGQKRALSLALEDVGVPVDIAQRHRPEREA